jgi:DNA-binding MarR family transcriptional regulator
MDERFQTFTVLVANLNRCIYKIKTEEMAEYNLKSSHVSCIYYIYRYGSLTPKELCDLCGEDKANISRALKYLEENQYLVINNDSNKKYQRPIVLTENGVKIGKHLSEKINEILSIASEGLSEEKRNIMYEGLSLINNRLNKICDEYENN